LLIERRALYHNDIYDISSWTLPEEFKKEQQNTYAESKQGRNASRTLLVTHYGGECMV